MTTAPVTLQPVTIHPVTTRADFAPPPPGLSPPDSAPRIVMPLATPQAAPSLPAAGIMAARAGIARLLQTVPVAGIAALLAIGAIALVHVMTASSVDPVSSPLSTYALSARSSWLLVLACGALGTAGVVLAGQLPAIGRWSAYATAILLKLVVIFPTDPESSTAALSLSAQIHRYSAGAAFVLMGVIILSAAPRCDAAMRRWMLLSFTVATLMFGLTLAATFWPDFLAMQQWRGIPQRILLLVEAGAIGALGIHWHLARSRAGDDPDGASGVRNSEVNPAG